MCQNTPRVVCLKTSLALGVNNAFTAKTNIRKTNASFFVLLRAEITYTHVKFASLRLQQESEIHCTLKLTSLWKAFALGRMTYLHVQDKYASMFKEIHYFWWNS